MRLCHVELDVAPYTPHTLVVRFVNDHKPHVTVRIFAGPCIKPIEMRHLE